MSGVGGMPNVPAPAPAAPAADSRVVPVPIKAIDVIKDALEGAMHLSMGIDIMFSARDAAPKAVRSPLAEKIEQALRTIENMGLGMSPIERVDTHVFPLDQLTQEFIRSLMLERGWQRGEIHVGSAQGEVMARRVVHGATPEQLGGSVRLMPMSANTMVDTPSGWTLVESGAATP